jgi:hypothetical protein
MSSGGGTATRIHAAPGITGLGPRWSPDGAKIAFSEQTAGGPTVHTINANGSGKRTVAAGTVLDWQPTICPSLFDIPDNLQTVDDLDGDGLPNEVEEQETNTDPECPDTDEDGLLDPWEVPEGVAGSGFDVNQDGTADVGRDIVFGPYNGECNDSFGLRREPNGQNCGLVFEPDPLHKDVYVEMDWQDCVLGNCPELVGLVVDPSHHAPDMAGLLDVVNVFRDAPVANPDEVDGIDLHILVDEDISHDHNCDQGAAETRPTNFGTPPATQRPRGAGSEGDDLPLRLVRAFQPQADAPGVPPAVFRRHHARGPRAGSAS